VNEAEEAQAMLNRESRSGSSRQRYQVDDEIGNDDDNMMMAPPAAEPDAPSPRLQSGRRAPGRARATKTLSRGRGGRAKQTSIQSSFQRQSQRSTSSRSSNIGLRYVEESDDE